jgi:hypothetical protein
MLSTWITSSSRAGCLGGEKTSNPLFSDRRTSRLYPAGGLSSCRRRAERPPGEVGMYVNVPSEVFEVFQKVLEGKLDMWTDGDVIYVGEEKRPYFPVLMIGKGRIFIIEDFIE